MCIWQVNVIEKVKSLDPNTAKIEKLIWTSGTQENSQEQQVQYTGPTRASEVPGNRCPGRPDTMAQSSDCLSLFTWRSTGDATRRPARNRCLVRSHPSIHPSRSTDTGTRRDGSTTTDGAGKKGIYGVAASREHPRGETIACKNAKQTFACCAACACVRGSSMLDGSVPFLHASLADA